MMVVGFKSGLISSNLQSSVLYVDSVLFGSREKIQGKTFSACIVYSWKKYCGTTLNVSSANQVFDSLTIEKNWEQF